MVEILNEIYTIIVIMTISILVIVFTIISLTLIINEFVITFKNGRNQKNKRKGVSGQR